jgi:hypothetical protein
VSVGNLDEDGYQVIIRGGEVTICEPGGQLLAWVKRAANRLYLLIVNLSMMAFLMTW